MIVRDKRPKLNTQADSIHEKLFLIVVCAFSHLNLHVLFTLSFSKNISTNHVNLLSVDSDDMKPSKQVSFLFIIKSCFYQLDRQQAKVVYKPQQCLFLSIHRSVSMQIQFYRCVVNTLRCCKFDCLLYYLE